MDKSFVFNNLQKWYDKEKPMRRRKQTQEDGLLINCYEELFRETGKVPSVEEVQAKYRERYNNPKEI